MNNNNLSLCCAVAILVALASVGCAPSVVRYEIRTSAYLSHNLQFPSPNELVKVAVVAACNLDEPLLEEEVRGKIESLLLARGYSIEGLENADYFIYAYFAIDDGNTATRVARVWDSGGVVTTEAYSSTGEWATATTSLPESTSYVPYSYTYYTRFLRVDLLDRNRWVAAKDKDIGDTLVWRASTASQGQSSDLRSVIDYLVVATFEHFGQDTGRQVRLTLQEGDERVRALREHINNVRDD